MSFMYVGVTALVLTGLFELQEWAVVVLPGWGQPHLSRSLGAVHRTYTWGVIHQRVRACAVTLASLLHTKQKITVFWCKTCHAVNRRTAPFRQSQCKRAMFLNCVNIKIFCLNSIYSASSDVKFTKLVCNKRDTLCQLVQYEKFIALQRRSRPKPRAESDLARVQ